MPTSSPQSRCHSLAQLRQRVRATYLADEDTCMRHLLEQLALDNHQRQLISTKAASLVTKVRTSSLPSLMENFLAEYGLSTKEGIALMCMAEALLRVPDKTTISEFIEDKIEPGNWSSHLGHSPSQLINTSTWALLITGKLLAPSHPEVASQALGSSLKNLLKRLGEPVLRSAIAQAMKALGAQFVLGEDISAAIKNSRTRLHQGYTYSYDMLGEAARTQTDADNYLAAYSHAISHLASHCQDKNIANNPGISIKLSALHPRYEWSQKERILQELVPRVLQLAQQAKIANMGFNIDAEEADRLELSLDIIDALMKHKSLVHWHGLGVVVQAYSKRATYVLDWLYQLATNTDRHIMVRLVKGAYWDTEIKRAQVIGLEDFPVFTRKSNTDIAYLACAKQLLNMHDHIYAQFATHNAHSVAAIEYFAEQSHRVGQPPIAYEFQRLHGMGAALHQSVMAKPQKSDKTPHCRIYAPVGAHQELLAYLVRRLLENGANSSFVHQLSNPDISPEVIAKDPVSVALTQQTFSNPNIPKGFTLFGHHRKNSRGWDITDAATMQELIKTRKSWHQHIWQAKPLLATNTLTPATDITDTPNRPARKIKNPANNKALVGWVVDADPADIAQALENTKTGQQQWQAMPMSERLQCFELLAHLYEQHADELFCLLCKEAGKTWLDAVGELREAVDFIRYYALHMQEDKPPKAAGSIVCISPWNFPLAIFTGQITASLVAGNSVISKPAMQTCLVAFRAVQLMHQAGIPTATVQFLPGDGNHVGQALVSTHKVSGICFTGSTYTAQHIHQQMAQHLPVTAPLIAETGGVNAMIVDSTALPEQVTRDVLASAFQSAGQRCSALRMLYIQEEIAEPMLNMLCGAMAELQVGNPDQLSTDVGPVIDPIAKDKITQHIEAHKAQGNVIRQIAIAQHKDTTHDLLIAPTLIRVTGIEQLHEEIFGPVLHVATFKNKDLHLVVNSINAKGYGLTFGIHTRMDKRIEQLTSQINAGNIYVNRNQIGAVVGSQPFGGEGMSGTGPKAGGPQYVQRLRLSDLAIPKLAIPEQQNLTAPVVTMASVQTLIDQLWAQDDSNWQRHPQRPFYLAQVLGTSHVPVIDICRDKQLLAGPTGEINELRTLPRGLILCLGTDLDRALLQAKTALAQGNKVLIIAAQTALPQHNLPLRTLSGHLPANFLTNLSGINGVACQGTEDYLRALRIALAKRTGEILPLITHASDPHAYTKERHICIDTTAAGGNASLIATQE